MEEELLDINFAWERGNLISGSWKSPLRILFNTYERENYKLNLQNFVGNMLNGFHRKNDMRRSDDIQLNSFLVQQQCI